MMALCYEVIQSTVTQKRLSRQQFFTLDGSFGPRLLCSHKSFYQALEHAIVHI